MLQLRVILLLFKNNFFVFCLLNFRALTVFTLCSHF